MVVVPPGTQTPILVGLALQRLSQSAAYPPAVWQGASGMELMDWVTKGPVQGGREQAITGIQTPSNASGARAGGPHGHQMPIPATALNKPRGT